MFRNQQLLVKKRFIKSSTKTVVAVFLTLPFTAAIADIQPRSASLNYSQKSLSNAGNPAAAALIVERNDPHVITGGIIEIGAGVEYGDLDELFARIDELNNDFNPPSDPNIPGQPPQPSNPDRDYQWEDIFNEYPNLEDRLDIVKSKVATTAGLLALIAAEGYAKAEANGEATFVLNKNLYGGTLMFGTSYKGNAQVVGLFQDIDFDATKAKEQLQTLPDFNETDPIQALDLSGGITLFYDPANKKMKLSVDNDSLLLVKATQISQISLSYSRKLQAYDNGSLYWGIKPTFYRVGLTNVSAKIGAITDSEALFDDIENADFVFENGFDLDLGLVWAAPNYQVGASLTNLLEQTYKFPELDRTAFKSAKIISQLSKHETYTMERQLKLEAGVFTDLRHWSLNVELDANSISDPMSDDYQWLTVTGGYAADSWWLPSARIGFSRNLAGTKLAYVNAGVTVMKFLNIDIATTLDTVTLDGDEVNRGIHIRLGVQFDY